MTRTVSLPLSVAEDFLLTEKQRSRIAGQCLRELLDQGVAADLSGWARFAALRDEVKRRSGVNDAAASLAVHMNRNLMGGGW